MKAIGSADLLKEFTLYANAAADKEEIFIVQRANGKNMVMLSLDKYNTLNKKIYELQQAQAGGTNGK